MLKSYWKPALCGSAAGLINGLLGAGGGMILIPLLSILVKPEEDVLFPCSVSIMLPVCLISLAMTAINSVSLPWRQAMPYLLGSAFGGIIAGLLAKKIPTLYLHKGLGILIVWGGIRYLC